MILARTLGRSGWLAVALLAVMMTESQAAETPLGKKLQISGIYPHLAVYNGQGECGIGAVVPWADKLWMVTYPPHHTKGGPDKLYEIDKELNAKIRPESVGGTHACRMIHCESQQLIIGPYFVDDEGKVRACDLSKLTGRMTAVARHLTDPANKVYFFDMEGAIYEVDVHTLAVTRLFEKAVPGWHGKGGYTSQGRLVIANNGESAVGKKKREFLAGDVAKNDDEAGVLAEWDGKTWRIVERKQFLDVTGPGGIYGAPDDKSPLWSIGWDRRSVIVKLLDAGKWYTFRVPKASHCYDPKHGWYTEWPRIREAMPGRWMMDMHGMFYDFPVTFSAGKTGGLRPIASHLRYIPDFGHWNGRLILASDDASIMQNPMVGQSQSNLWFGLMEQLPGFGPRSGWGGPWDMDAVKANEPSDPFLFAGFDRRVAHLAHRSDAPVAFKLELDAKGDGQWKEYQTVTVPAKGYVYHVFPAGLEASWVRVTADKACTATAYFHYASARDASHDTPATFDCLAKVSDQQGVVGGLIRPAGHNRSLQLLAQTVGADGQSSQQYYEMELTADGTALALAKPADDRSAEVKRIAEVKQDFEVDEASVIMTRKDRRVRLPKGDARYDQPFACGWPRGIRECVSERFLMNIHGTFYEMPRDDGLPLVKPVCSHGRQIMDFCTWRGVMVLCGTRRDAQPGGQSFRSADGAVGLWLGSIDDLWKLGKPVGRGGPWLNTAVKAQQPSDPYLMTGYDRKRIEMSHAAAGPVKFTVEVDIDHKQWTPYQTFTVLRGQTVTHDFPEGFNAHWVRVRVDRDCRASTMLTYQ